jgi:hypothetical protein
METPRQGRTQPAVSPDRNAPPQHAFSRRIDCAPKQDPEQPQHGAGHGNGPHGEPDGDV